MLFLPLAFWGSNGFSCVKRAVQPTGGLPNRPGPSIACSRQYLTRLWRRSAVSELLTSMLAGSIRGEELGSTSEAPQKVLLQRGAAAAAPAHD